MDTADWRVHGYYKLVHSDDPVQDGLPCFPHQVNESLRGPHLLRYLIVGQQFWDPIWLTSCQAKLLVQDLVHCPNRDPMDLHEGPDCHSVISFNSGGHRGDHVGGYYPFLGLETPMIVGIFPSEHFFKMPEIAIFLTPLSP
jgi:hypothetical protein